MSTPVPDLSSPVRAAFNEAYLAVFRIPPPRSVRGSEVVPGFAARYQQLRALPRRVRRAMQRRWKHTLGAIALLMALGQAPAYAATLQVSPNTPPAINADGKCSLIEAIVNANRNARTHLDCVAGSGADTIVLPAHSSQVLNGTALLPDITSRIVIEGHGSTVSRNTFTVGSTFFTVAANGNLTLNDTTVSGAVAGRAGGQGITNRGRLTLNDSHVSSHFLNGLTNIGGVAVITNSSLTDNASRYDGGGGIYNRDGGSINVRNSVIARNGAYFSGAGIFNGTGCSATVVDSVVSDNHVDYEGGGGGIANYGTLVLIGATVAGNQAYGGGGISNDGTATIRRSTISGNRTVSSYDYRQYGAAGGISNTGKLTLSNSTVSGNEAPAYGGGISQDAFAVGRVGQELSIESSTVTGNTLVVAPPLHQQGGGQGGGVFVKVGKVSLQRSIVSGNQASSGREIGVAQGVVVTANDFNLFGHDGDAGLKGFTAGSTDIVPNKSVGGILLPLADNGGQTRTHALAINSPALDASPDDATCPTIDQREVPRPRGAACDIGSFEGSAVMCNGHVSTMVGTDGPDELTGTPGPDVIASLGGNDTINGLGGGDLVCAGSGADQVNGGAGNDVLFGQDGNDVLNGNGGNDTLNGGAGQDLCNGGQGVGDTATACETVKSVP
jgi:hypothetical protein